MEPRTGLRLVVLLVGVKFLTEFDLSSQRVRVEGIRHFQRPAKGPASNGTVDALKGGMHPRTSTRKGGGRIRNHLTGLGDTPQK